MKNMKLTRLQSNEYDNDPQYTIYIVERKRKEKVETPTHSAYIFCDH